MCTWLNIVTERPFITHTFADQWCIEPDIIGTLNFLPEQLVLALPCQPALLFELQWPT